jgi:hypothetical protein
MLRFSPRIALFSCSFHNQNPSWPGKSLPSKNSDEIIAQPWLRDHGRWALERGAASRAIRDRELTGGRDLPRNDDFFDGELRRVGDDAIAA